VCYLSCMSKASKPTLELVCHLQKQDIDHKEVYNVLLPKKVGMTHHLLTHLAKKDYNETPEEFLCFMSMMHQKDTGMNPDDILNMDQTPIPFSYHSYRTLEKKDAKPSMFAHH